MFEKVENVGHRDHLNRTGTKTIYDVLYVDPNLRRTAPELGNQN